MTTTNVYANVATATGATLLTFGNNAGRNRANRPAKLSAMQAISGGYTYADGVEEYTRELCADFANMVRTCDSEASLDQFYNDVAAHAVSCAEEYTNGDPRPERRIAAQVSMKVAKLVLGTALRRTARQSAQSAASSAYMETGSADALIAAASVGLDTGTLVQRRADAIAQQAENRKRAERNERARQRRAGL